MPATAPRTTRPAASSARRSTRASSAAAATRRTAVPPLTIVKGPPGPAIKLGNTAAARDPRFNRVIEKLEKSSAKAKEHVPPARKAAEAQAAALPPANEKLALAQADQVDTMKDAETKKPEPDSFLTLLRAEIEKAMPKNLGATENFMKGDDKEKLKGAATGNVNQQKEAATSGIKSASNQPPDPGQVAGKEVQPLPSEGAPPQPPAVGAADALPAAKPDDEVSLQKSKDEANKSLADANVTPEQLQKANDPRFSAVLTSKSTVEKQADTAPQKYRSEEQKAITQAAGKAVGDEKKGLQALHGTQGKTANSVKARQLAAKAQDEAKRKEVTAHIQQIYNETKQAVDKKLSGLEKEVSDMFDKGMEAALANMTDYIDSRMSKWKFERYLSIPGGLLLWAKDKLFGLPDEVNVFYEEGRKRFLKDLDLVILDIAKLVDTRLKEAKDEITNGQKRISDYVNGLPKDLQSVGKAAEKEMASRFDELRQGVDDKKNELAQNLAQRYKEANDKANDKLKEMQSENKGLVSVLKEKLGEVVKILTEFKERIMGMLKQGKAAIDLIVADPIGFLKNLLNAVKQGLNQFVNNIWTHLKAGFMAWLFGSLAEMGIEMPKDFSLGSILKLVLQVLGLTYPRIRAKAVKLVGERTVKILETAADFVVAFVTGGAAALWEKVKEYLGNLKEMLINAVQDWVVTSVIKAAITKLATMFNPVGAIIQAIITIYNTVMFFIERINQILDFVQAIVSSVYKIATGDISSAANWIEQALARTIPIIIGFLARLLGLSGLADKIKGFILKIQDKVDKAIDLVIQKIVSGIGKLFGKGKAGEDKAAASPQEARWKAAVAAIHADLTNMEQEGISDKELSIAVKKWQEAFGFQTLAVEAKEDEWIIVGSMSPPKDVDRVARPGSKKKPFKLTWPKPPSENYLPIYLGGKTSKIKSQSALQGLFTKKQKDDTGTEVQIYYPHERKKILGGPTIGLTQKFRIGTGTIVGPLSDAGTPGGETLNEVLREYGFNPTREGMDADHVREIQFGGEDRLENLWPLDASTNRSAGATLKGASVEYPTSGKTITIAELKQNKSRQYYFRIVKFSK